MLGTDVRGFKHSISEQAIMHIRRGHPNVTVDDLKRLPEVVKSGSAALAKDRGVNGVARVVYRAELNGVKYEYVGEVRRRQKRIDAITFYRL